MKRHTIYNILFIAILAVAAVSCQKWEEPEFQVPHYDGPAANKTIADIKAKHVTGTGKQEPICNDNEEFIVKATVVSSDRGGNCYKYMTLQDETGGIEIAIDRTGLYNEYPVGQTVYLNCKGLIVGDYHGKHQIGWAEQRNVGRINPLMLDQYLQKDGLPDPDCPFVAHPFEINGLDDLNADYVNCLVKIDNCKFDAQYDGLPLATNDLIMDREIHVNGATITVRTSNYANFRSTIIDANKSYCLYGILTMYNTDYQLTLRTKDDIQAGSTSQKELVKDITFDENSLTTGGWTTTNGWQFQNYGGDKFMFHNSTSSACDDWLISPELTFDNLTGVTLQLDHKNNVEGSPANYYEVYYSTTYNGGEFDASQWTAFNPNLNNFQSVFALSNALDVTAIGNPTFRIAIRYHKDGAANGTRWYIRGLQFYQQL